MRILLVRLSALGDVVTALHVLATLRARCPSAHLGWIVEAGFAGLLEGQPELNSLHRWPRRRLRRIPALLRELRRGRYDVALDLQGNLKSGLIARASGARRILGLGGHHSREGNRFFVRERIQVAPGHRNTAYEALVTAAVGAGPNALGSLPAPARPHHSIVLHPGASRFGAFKRWPPASFAALADRLSERLGAPVLLTAGPGEREEAEAVLGAMRTPATIAATPGLPALASLLAGARLVVAGDTGPAHIAAAAGAPTLVLFGPKDPAVMVPWGRSVLAVREGVRCSPCALRYCPDPICMSALTVDRVMAAALELLGESR